MHRIGNTSDIKPNWKALAPDDGPSLSLSIEATASGATFVFSAVGDFNVAFESKQGTFGGVFSPTSDTPTVLVQDGQSVSVPPGIGNVGIDDTILPSEPGQSYTVRFKGTSGDGTVVTGERTYTLPELGDISVNINPTIAPFPDNSSTVNVSIIVDTACICQVSLINTSQQDSPHTVTEVFDQPGTKVVVVGDLLANTTYNCSVTASAPDFNTNEQSKMVITAPAFPEVNVFEFNNDGSTFSRFYVELSRSGSVVMQNAAIDDGESENIEFVEIRRFDVLFNDLDPGKQYECSVLSITDLDGNTKPGSTPPILYTTPNPLVITATLNNVPYPDGMSQLLAEYSTNKGTDLIVRLTNAVDGNFYESNDSFSDSGSASLLYGSTFGALLRGVEYTLTVTGTAPGEEVVATAVATTLVFPFTVDLIPDAPPRGDTTLLFDISAQDSCTVDYELYVSPRLAGSTTVENGTAELGGANSLTRQLRFESLIANTAYSCYYVVTTPGGEATGRIGSIHTATSGPPITADLEADEFPEGRVELLFNVHALVAGVVEYELRLDGNGALVDVGSIALSDSLSEQVRFTNLVLETTYTCNYTFTAPNISYTGVLSATTLDEPVPGSFSGYYGTGTRNNYTGEIGTSFVAANDLTVYAFGRMPTYRTSNNLSELHEYKLVRLYDSQTQTMIRECLVGPGAYQWGTYRYENLDVPVQLTQGKTYVISQLCTAGMPDLWLATPIFNGANTGKINQQITTTTKATYVYPHDPLGGYPTNFGNNNAWPIAGFLSELSVNVWL